MALQPGKSCRNFPFLTFYAPLLTVLPVILAAFFSPLVAHPGPADDPPGTGIHRLHLVSRISHDNGLPSNKVYNVIQDFRGYLWITTAYGLARFDGQNITVFHHVAGNSASLVDNLVKPLTVTSDSLLWIGGIDGISVYNPFASCFTSYSFYNQKERHFPVKSVTCFYEDRDHSMWIGTEDGLVHATGNPLRFERISIRGNNDPSSREYNFNFISKIIADPRNNDHLLLATLGGVLVFDKQQKVVAADYRKIINNGYDIIDFFTDGDSILWCGGWGIGLNCLDLKRKIWNEFPGDPVRPWSVTGITPIDERYLWVAVIDHGLALFDKKHHCFSYPPFEQQEGQSSVNGSVISVRYINQGKNIAVVSTDGITILRPGGLLFDQVDVPFQSYHLTAFLLDDDRNQLLVGAVDGEGLYILNRETGRWHVIRPGRPPGKYGFTIHSLLKDSRGKIWAGTRDNLYRYDPGRKTLRQFTDRVGKPLPLSDPWIYGLMEDSKGNLWVGTRSEGVFVLDPDRTGATHYFHREGDIHSLIKGGRFRSFCEDRYQRVWIGGDDGACLFDLSSGHFLNALMDSMSAAGITKRWINSMVRDTLGRIWLGIDGEGLLRVDRFGEGSFRFKTYGPESGLTESHIGRMAVDPNGILWLVSWGLLRLNPYDETVYMITEHNGLRRRIGVDENICTDPEGNIYLAFANHFETKNTADIDLVSPEVKPILESVDINDRNCPLEMGKEGIMPLDLSADQKNIIFRYTAICYDNTGQLRFRYRLEGYDTGWIYAGRGREARYTNLPPARYTFRFMVSERGIWRNEQGRLTFVIRQVFWKTWWFLAASLIILVTFGFLAYRYRLQQLLRLERLRTRIAGDLHDDIGSTLSSISIISDILQKQPDHPGLGKMVGTIGRNAHAMLEKLDDIIWTVNPTNDKFQNLALRLREFAIPLFESAGIRFDIRFDPALNELTLPMEIRRNIWLIAKEAITNAVKYSGSPFIAVSVTMFHSGLQLTVTDEGKGFNADRPTSRNGIRNMKMRASQIKGELEIDTGPSQGTRITLRLKTI